MGRINHYKEVESGFSLIELMVAMVIGLITTLVITQVFSTFEGQKRSTGATSDAQTNGALAVYSMEREMLMAGYGLPLFSTKVSPMKCTTGIMTVDHDGDAGTPELGFAPIQITDGGSNGESDIVTVRYSSSATAGANGGVPMTIVGVAGNIVSADVAIGCSDADVVMFISGSSCAMTRVSGTPVLDPLGPDNVKVISSTNAVAGSTMACLGRWSEVTFQVGHAENRYWLEAIDSKTAQFPNPAPLQAEIVNIQVQYGIAATRTDFDVIEWVDATGSWAAPTLDDRNRIRAIRLALLARSALAEKDDVTTECSGKICASWEDPVRSGLSRPSPDLKIAAPGTDWKKYRYRVYQAIVPLRNLIWSSQSL